jgi:hypothetical protein
MAQASDEDRHPDVADLELARTGEAPADVRDHALTCPHCREVVEQLASVADALAVPADTQRAGEAVPASVDKAIEAAIRRRAAAIRSAPVRVRLPLWRRPGWAAVAAAVLVLGIAGLLAHRFLHGGPGAAPWDINRDGTVDIVDAYRMASELEAGASVPRRWDLTRDGRVDDRDVAAVAARAVRLEGT